MRQVRVCRNVCLREVELRIVVYEQHVSRLPTMVIKSNVSSHVRGDGCLADTALHVHDSDHFAHELGTSTNPMRHTSPKANRKRPLSADSKLRSPLVPVASDQQP